MREKHEKNEKKNKEKSENFEYCDMLIHINDKCKYSLCKSKK